MDATDNHPGKLGREHPRFEQKSRVLLSAEGRAEVLELWTNNISRGGMFVETPEPPETGTVVSVQLQTPDGTVELKAEVVHSVPLDLAEQYGSPAGAGLQFKEVDAAVAAAIRRYLEGAAQLTSTADVSTVSAELTAVLQQARLLMQHAEDGDLYRALDVAPQVDGTALAARTTALRQMFGSPYASASPAQTARLATALRTLEKVHSLLTDEQRRLEYDFRSGNVRAEERVLLAPADGPRSVARLRQTWTTLFPDRHERAGAMAMRSVDEEAKGNIAAALAALQTALELDPFNTALVPRIQELQALKPAE